jgi:hypothetical protein
MMQVDIPKLVDEIVEKGAQMLAASSSASSTSSTSSSSSSSSNRLNPLYVGREYQRSLTLQGHLDKAYADGMNFSVLPLFKNGQWLGTTQEDSLDEHSDPFLHVRI